MSFELGMRTDIEQMNEDIRDYEEMIKRLADENEDLRKRLEAYERRSGATKKKKSVAMKRDWFR